MFALKYHDFPAMADHYLVPQLIGRAAYLAATVDKVPASAEQSASLPRDINSIEWFAPRRRSVPRFRRARQVSGRTRTGPVRHGALDQQRADLSLSPGTWPRVWFKGGSEPGVLTLGYLARDNRGQTFVVVVLTEDTSKPVQESAAVEIQALDVISGRVRPDGLTGTSDCGASPAPTGRVPSCHPWSLAIQR